MAIAVITLLFQAQNRLQFPGDEVAHLITSVQVYNSPTRALTMARPPLPFLLTAVFYRVGGVSKTIALLSNQIWFSLMWFGTAGIAYEIVPSRSAIWISQLLLLSFPMTLGMARMYMTEPCLTAMVVLSVLALIWSRSLQDRFWSLVFGLLFGLGFLSKGSFPLFLIAPLLWALAQTIRMGSKDRRASLTNLILAFGLAAPIALIWLDPQTVLGGVGRLSHKISHPGQNPDLCYGKGLILYLYSIVDFSIGAPMALVMAGCIAAYRRQSRYFSLLLVSIVAPLLILNNFEWRQARYLFPILPLLAATAGAGLSAISRRAIRSAFSVFLVIWTAGFVWSVTSVSNGLPVSWFVETPWNATIFRYFGFTSVNYHEDFWIRPPSSQSFGLEQILAEMAAADADGVIQHAYVFLNSGNRGEYGLPDGSRYTDPLSFPIEAKALLTNSRQYTWHYSFIQNEVLWQWEPDPSARVALGKIKTPCFVLSIHPSSVTVIQRLLPLKFLVTLHSCFAPVTLMSSTESIVHSEIDATLPGN